MEEEIKQLRKDMEDLKIKLMSVDTKVEAYKAAMEQVTNLAFGLIGSATIAIIFSRVR